MNEVVRILMERDGMSKHDAKSTLEEVREEVYAAIDCGSYEEVDDIIQDCLGLEPDYIMDIL